MPINGMNTGQDYTYQYYDPYSGEIVDFGDIESVHVTAMKHAIKSQRYNNIPRHGYIPDGYSIRISTVRTNPNVENLQLAANRRFNDGQETLPGYLQETVRESGGAVSRYQYIEAVVWVDDLGDIRRESNVKQQIEFMAGDKVQIA